MLSTAASSPRPLAPPTVQDEATRGSRPDCILLDTVANGVNYHWKSLTAAIALASTAKALVMFKDMMGVGMEAEVEVTFRFFEPPDVSSFVVHCRGMRGDSLAHDSFVVSAEGDMVLLYITLLTHRPGLYFVYRTCHGHPSLEVLPRPSRPFDYIHKVGILPRGKEGYVVAASIGVKYTVGVLKYEIFLYSSKTKVWSTKLAPLYAGGNSDLSYVRNHRTNKVITVGDDSLGWVDLWWGIMVCNLLDEEGPTVCFIEMPGPMLGYEDLFGTSSARSSRDAICVGDLMKFIEIYNHEGDHGWTAIAWDRMLSSKDWHHCFSVDTDDIPITDEIYSHLPPVLQVNKTENLSLNDILCYGPTLSMDEDVFYMIFKLSHCPWNNMEWQAAINMNKNSLKLVSFTDEERLFCDPTYRSCALSKYQHNEASGY